MVGKLHLFSLTSLEETLSSLMLIAENKIFLKIEIPNQLTCLSLNKLLVHYICLGKYKTRVKRRIQDYQMGNLDQIPTYQVMRYPGHRLVN